MNYESSEAVVDCLSMHELIAAGMTPPAFIRKLILSS